MDYNTKVSNWLICKVLALEVHGPIYQNQLTSQNGKGNKAIFSQLCDSELEYCLDNDIRKEFCVKLLNDPYSECIWFTFDSTDTARVTLFTFVLPDLAS